MHLLTERVFSSGTLSIFFRMEFSLNKRLVWQFLGLKLTILRAFFRRIGRRLMEPGFCAQTREE